MKKHDDTVPFKHIQPARNDDSKIFSPFHLLAESIIASDVDTASRPRYRVFSLRMKFREVYRHTLTKTIYGLALVSSGNIQVLSVSEDKLAIEAEYDAHVYPSELSRAKMHDICNVANAMLDEIGPLATEMTLYPRNPRRPDPVSPPELPKVQVAVESYSQEKKYSHPQAGASPKKARRPKR